MTENKLNKWFESLRDIWLSKTPNKAELLVADKFFWSENPFQNPITNKKELLEEWQGVLKQKDVKVEYKLLSTQDNVGIATWKSSFTWTDTNISIKMKGIWYVVLDEKGKCIEFRQWFNIKQPN